METILNIKDKPDVKEMMNFIKELTVEEQKTVDILLKFYKVTKIIEAREPV